jgi:DNA-binding transcriptional ArsR family regulator
VGEALRAYKAELYKALGHPTRIRILEILREGETSVSDLQAALGIDAALVSQQLAVLRARRLVEARRAGTSVFYRVRDPRVGEILDVGRALYVSHLAELRAGLDAADAEAAGPRDAEAVGAREGA